MNKEIAVIGAGHAGIEAALAAARLGCSVLCFCTSLDSIGNLPCNPAIGGSAKGHLVREIDALGGEMAKAADICCIQYRMLNRGKGPAVHSLRAQADRARYSLHMKRVLEKEPNIRLKQAEIVSVETENGSVSSVTTAHGGVFPVSCVIIATGTFLRGRTIIGECVRASGPDGLLPANSLYDSLISLGLPLRRFKTGTPPRVSSKTIDYSKLIPQYGDEDIPPFSFSTTKKPENLIMCHQTHTTEQTHDIIRRNLHRSPMHQGVIDGVGARYCPSIEDKIVRFADKEKHHLFLEPCGLETDEVYVQGLSSSMPEEVQLEILHSIPGLEKAEVMRTGYGIEYECIDPLALHPTMEIKNIPGLFCAGQFCSTSGYEEAAALGLVAGINAAHKLLNREALILPRSGSYIGTLIDDLCTRGTGGEPYRMMTSRSEYRLLLRQDNADERLIPIGYKLGLINVELYEKTLKKIEIVNEEINRIENKYIQPTVNVNDFLQKHNSSPISSGTSIAALVKRPELSYDSLAPFDPERPVLETSVKEKIEITLRYQGYIRRQERSVAEFKRLEEKLLPKDIDYAAVQGLRLEARERLAKIRPVSLGQAGRIPGVNPADITALMVYIERHSHE